MKLPAVVVLIILHTFLVDGCPNDCNGHGWCQHSICSCSSGYFEKDCSKSIADDHSSQLIGLQAFIGTLFLSIALLCSVSLYHVFIRHYSSVAFVNNIQLIVFGSYLVVAVTQFLYAAIDPLRVWGLLPHVVSSLLFCTVFPFSLLAFVAILFHWIDLINISVTTLRKEEMLQKISMNYKPKDVTLEDMVEKLQFLGKLKIPFGFFIGLLFMIIYVTQIFSGLEIRVPLMHNIMFGVAFVYYMVTAMGFLIYRKKLISIMPFQLTGKVRRLTARITLLCIYILIAMLVLVLIYILVPREQPDGYLALWTIIELVIAFVCYATVAVFLNWRKRFPFVTFSAHSTRTSSKQGALQTSLSGPAEDTEDEISLQPTTA